MCQSKKTFDFISKAHSVHGYKYNYDKFVYTRNNVKSIIICPEHGEFLQDPYHHLYGNGKGCGCPLCSKSINKLKNDFIKKAKLIHENKYDYSKIEYKNSFSEIIIICPKHGEFKQLPCVHLRGSGCPSCGLDKILATSNINRNNFEYNFIEKSIKIHGNKYDYSKVEYKNAHKEVCIICPEHGEFWQTPFLHSRGHGCPICSESHGEREIRKWLDNHDIKYEREKTFSELNGVGGFPLRFDFYLPEHNMCIEFDGKQHREWIKGMQTKQQFLDLQEHDRRKNKFCENNGIKLIRIWKTNLSYDKLVFQ